MTTEQSRAETELEQIASGNAPILHLYRMAQLFGGNVNPEISGKVIGFVLNQDPFLLSPEEQEVLRDGERQRTRF